MKKQQSFDEWLTDFSPLDKLKTEDKWYDGITTIFYRITNYFGGLPWRIKQKHQRWFRGYSDSEIWNLDHTIVDFILPRLEAFKNYERHGFPILDPKEQNEPMPGCKEDEERWEYMLDEMIWSFRYLKFSEESPDGYPEFSFYSRNQETGEWEINKERIELLNNRKNRGLDYFVRYLHSLWD
jgi:hypothetical protein